MGRRIEKVTIALAHGDVVIPWASREALLARFDERDAARLAFENAGTSAPVKLTSAQRMNLTHVIVEWAMAAAGGYDDLPEGIADLRNELRDDLPDAPAELRSS